MLSEAVARRVGENILTIDDPLTGWPSKASLVVDGEKVKLALHVGPVGSSNRGRDLVERRFQNPGADKPIDDLGGRFPLLIGLWDEENTSILVGLDGRSRLGRTTRFSLFVPLQVLREAKAKGWVEHLNGSHEKVIAFLPGLLPAYVQLIQSNADIQQSAVTAIISTEGMSDEENGAADRGRRSITSLIRNAAFSTVVRSAYDGRCAMCGLSNSLTVGAHIFPVSAAGSQDKVWNGIALCHNHHALFDMHKVHIHPETFAISLHPDIQCKDPATWHDFFKNTFNELRLPSLSKLKPRGEMLSKRYEFYIGHYKWAQS